MVRAQAKCLQASHDVHIISGVVGVQCLLDVSNTHTLVAEGEGKRAYRGPSMRSTSETGDMGGTRSQPVQRTEAQGLCAERTQWLCRNLRACQRWDHKS